MNQTPLPPLLLYLLGLVAIILFSLIYFIYRLIKRKTNKGNQSISDNKEAVVGIVTNIISILMLGVSIYFGILPTEIVIRKTSYELLQRADLAYQSGNYDTLYDCLIDNNLRSNDVAIMNLGFIWENGIGFADAPDEVKYYNAINYYSRAYQLHNHNALAAKLFTQLCSYSREIESTLIEACSSNDSIIEAYLNQFFSISTRLEEGFDVYKLILNMKPEELTDFIDTNMYEFEFNGEYPMLSFYDFLESSNELGVYEESVDKYLIRLGIEPDPYVLFDGKLFIDRSNGIGRSVRASELQNIDQLVLTLCLFQDTITFKPAGEISALKNNYTFSSISQ